MTDSAVRRFTPRRRRPERRREELRAPMAAQLVLQQALRAVGLDHQIARYEFVLRWPEIVGAEIAKRTRPECIRNNTLVIRVASSVWAQELSFQKEIILRRLRRLYPEHDMVHDIHFYVAGNTR